MLENLFPVRELRGLARRKRRPDDFKTVRHSLVAEEEGNGWEVARKNRTSSRLKRRKQHSTWLEDRVWTLLHRMGFQDMSGEGGAKLVLNPRDTNSPTNQIDVVAIDGEVALAIECKSAASPKRLQSFQDDLAKFNGLRESFTRAVRTQYGGEYKQPVAFVLFTSEIILTDNDRKRADDAKVLLFDANELTYYETLAAQVGPAARYQLLADLLPGREISGLSLDVPAVKTRMGGYSCYTFSVSPEYLLKIAYVSHRTKGKPSDVDTYQRMLKKGRLANIRDYISRGGVFPTNIVVNIPERWLRFERVKQEGEGVTATVGWLRLKPAYKCAWIIDGQHRLYAYSGHPLASKSIVSVLAFSGLPPSEQANLFVTINAEQRKVKRSLLQELYAELHWDAEDPEERSNAILSKAILALDIETGSPFHGRILKADEARTAKRCITLTSIFSAMEKADLFVTRAKRGGFEYGPLWAESSEATVKRTISLLRGWFSVIRTETSTVWELGAAEGGGLAMNDGVTVCINVLRSVIEHCQNQGIKLRDLTDAELVEVVTPYATTLGRYFAALGPEEMRQFRNLRGVQGQTLGTRRCQQLLSRDHKGFNPPGLQQFLDLEKAQTNEKAREVIIAIEQMLQSTVLEELKREYGTEDSAWWFAGVPIETRTKVADRIEKDQGKNGGREENFDLIDYRSIILKKENWAPLFEEIFAKGEGSKEAKTKWIVDVNEIRKKAMHASRGAHLPVTGEQLAFLEDIETWLREKTDTN